MQSDITVVVTGQLFDEEGNLKQKFVKHNLITNTGYTFLANCFGNYTRPAPMRYIAVGDGATAPTLEDIALESEITRKEASFDYADGSKFLAIGITLMPKEGTGALTEAGILNADNILFDRVTFPVINKGDLDTYVLSFNLEFSEVEDLE